jgi:hypothetical protein
MAILNVCRTYIVNEQMYFLPLKGLKYMYFLELPKTLKQRWRVLFLCFTFGFHFSIF